MQFSPFVLLRHPTYDLTHLDAFSTLPDQYHVLDEAIDEKRKYFLDFITSKDLLLSLPFSSKTVYQAIPHYEFHAAVKIRKKEKQTERALMKYLARMSLNPSPLASFAKSQIVDWEWNALKPNAQYILSLSLTQRKEFFDLCYCDVGLQKYMKYRLNPSLRRVPSGFIYLHMDGLEKSRVELESDSEFEAMFEELKRKDFTFAQFMEKTNYAVNDFLEAQLIVPSYPIYAAHDFIATLIKDINKRHRLSFKLEDIIGIYKKEITDTEAIAQQKHWETQIKAYAKSLEVVLDHKLYPERIYYLNTYSRKKFEKPSLNKELVTQEVLELITLAESTMKKELAPPLNWTTVYESLPPPTIIFDLSEIEIEQKSKSEIELKLPLVDTLSKYYSFGIMLSFTDRKQPNLINVSTPYGKFFSPALEFVSDKTKESIKQWIKDTAKNAVNLKDASLHNKNVANEFIPEMNNFGIDYQTPIEERVFLDFDEDGVVINEDSEEIVSMVNLGIEDYRTRSSFYQNLYSQSKQLPSIPDLVEAIQNEYRIKKDEAVSFVPRLSTKHLILGSQKWKASKEAFEGFQNAKEIPLEQINNWRKSYGIPRIVECNIDNYKPIFIDFYNPWSVDSFLKLIRKMELACTFMEMGFGDDIGSKRLYEAYYEVSI
jgi:hypothetical protein